MNKKILILFSVLFLVVLLLSVIVISQTTQKIVGSSNVIPLKTTEKQIGIQSTPVIQYGLGVYWDASCTNRIINIDWGALNPGSVANKIIYIRNEGSQTGTLFMTTKNWNPSHTANYLNLVWNYNEQPVNPNQVVQVTLTLTVSSNIIYANPPITTYTFDIIIGDPAVSSELCLTPGTECDGKKPYQKWCEDVNLKKCDSDCAFSYDKCSVLCNGDKSTHSKLSTPIIWDSNWQTSNRDVATFYSPNCPSGYYPISCLSESANEESEGNYGDDDIMTIKIDGSRCKVTGDDTVTYYEQKRKLGVVCSNQIPTIIWDSNWQIANRDVATFYSPNCPSGIPISCLSESANEESEGNYGEDNILTIKIDGSRCKVTSDDNIGNYEQKRKVGVVCSNQIPLVDYECNTNCGASSDCHKPTNYCPSNGYWCSDGSYGERCISYDRDFDFRLCTLSASYCNAYSWNIGGEVAATTCCGDDSYEFRDTCRIGVSEDACYRSIDNEACCNANTDCVFNGICYNKDYTGDVDNDGTIEFCYEGVWRIKEKTTSTIYPGPNRGGGGGRMPLRMELSNFSNFYISIFVVILILVAIFIIFKYSSKKK